MSDTGTTAEFILAAWKVTWSAYVNYPIDDNFKARFLASEAVKALRAFPKNLVLDAIRANFRLADALLWIDAETRGGMRAVTCPHGYPRGECHICRRSAPLRESNPFGARNVHRPPTGGIARGDL